MKKFLLLFIVCALVIAIVTQLPGPRLHIVMCNVGQGDGILIQKGSTQMVIDAGPDNSILTCLGEHMPFWDRTIEVALMTHSDADHYAGFAQMIERYTVSQFIGSPIDSDAKAFARLKETILRHEVPQTPAVAGKVIQLADGVSMRILFPHQDFLTLNSKEVESSQVLGSRSATERNDFSAITLLTYGKFTGLFTGDTSPAMINEMLRENIVPQAYFLKIPHHGSKNGLTKSMLETVKPTLAAISVGVKNRYGHPSPEVLSLLQGAQVTILRTDLLGTFEIVTDGEQIWSPVQ